MELLKSLNRDDLVYGAFSVCWGSLYGSAIFWRAAGGLVVHTVLGGVVGACAGLIVALACKKLLERVDGSFCLEVLTSGAVISAANLGFIPWKASIVISLAAASSALHRANEIWNLQRRYY